MIVVWGFILSLAGLFSVGCFEAFKIVSVVPGAFVSAPAILHNPMSGARNDHRPNLPRRGPANPEPPSQAPGDSD
jgi:hypothetical protein